MTEIRQGETQKDFFTDLSGTTNGNERFPSLQKTQKPILLNTSLEQLLLGAILFILALCFVFFLGVLRGRSLGMPVPAPPAIAKMPTQAGQDFSAVKNTTAVIRPTQAASVTGAGDASKPYTIQLVTYRKKDLADSEASTLRRAGFTATIIASGEYYVVCAGRYSGKDDAKQDLKVLSSKYKGCFLRRQPTA